MNVNITRTLLVASIAIWGVVFYRAASAQGFTDEPTCYSWEGGHKSAGSFSKCPGPWVMAQAKPKPVPVPAPVVAAPVVQTLPPMQSCPPLPAPAAKKHRPIVKPKPRIQC